jgi:hypothetical protein
MIKTWCKGLQVCIGWNLIWVIYGEKICLLILKPKQSTTDYFF